MFAGEKAEHIKSSAADMANVTHAKINGVEQARYDYSTLTPEQRARGPRALKLRREPHSM